jgi:hypothetical protein
VTAVVGAALCDPFVAAGGFAAWVGGTAAFARRQLAARPRVRTAVASTLATSAAIPAAAVWHRIAGEFRAFAIRRQLGPQGSIAAHPKRSAGVHP